jgi:hypothetical protein
LAFATRLLRFDAFLGVFSLEDLVLGLGVWSREDLPLICPVCGREVRLIAAVTEQKPVQRILRHIGEPPLPPPVSPARSPPEKPAFDWNPTAGPDTEAAEPPPEFEFDQTVSW